MSSRDNPFGEIERLFEEMNEGLRAFDTSLGGEVPVDVLDTGEAYEVCVDLPGYDREGIDVRLSDRTLTVEAERSTETETESGESGDRYVRRERTRESVSRTVHLPDAVEAGGTSATYEDGVLTVRLPKREADGGESIPIE
jgi:HSP20 family protein